MCSRGADVLPEPTTQAFQRANWSFVQVYHFGCFVLCDWLESGPCCMVHGSAAFVAAGGLLAASSAALSKASTPLSYGASEPQM